MNRYDRRGTLSAGVRTSLFIALIFCSVFGAREFAVGACAMQCRESYCWGAGDEEDCTDYEPANAFDQYMATQADGVIRVLVNGSTTDAYESYTCTNICGAWPGPGITQEQGACGMDVFVGTFSLYECAAET